MDRSSRYKDNAFEISMESNISGMSIINDELFIFCEDCINKVEMGTKRDPENKHTFSPNTKTKILHKGTKDNVVKQMFEFLQGIEQKRFGEVQAITFNPKVNMEEVKSILFEILLNCSTFADSYANLLDTYNEQLQKLEVPARENNFEIEAFIPNLEKLVKDVIITECGSLLNKLSRLIVAFYKFELSNKKISEILKNDKRLDNAIRILEENKIINNDSDLSKLVKDQCKEFLSEFVDIRNALEHPDHKKYIRIKNFYLLPDRNFQAPMWELHLSNKQEEKNLIDDLVEYCKNTIRFAFSLINILIQDCFESYFFCENGGIYQYSKEREKQEKKSREQS